MFRPRVIPVLLLQKDILVKSERFSKHRYIGDPLNAVRLFNEHRVDELVLLDIEASKKKRYVDPRLVASIGEEADMPFAAGGGITTIQQIKAVIAAGAEKVVIGSAACTNPGLIKEAADTFGSAAITVCMDVKKNWLGKERVYYKNATVSTKYVPEVFAEKMESLGAGELIVQSVANDGKMSGYDISVLKRITAVTSLPVIALGGAGSVEHLKEGYEKGLASGLAAGSLFVYNNSNKGVLINYPENVQFLNRD